MLDPIFWLLVLIVLLMMALFAYLLALPTLLKKK